MKKYIAAIALSFFVSGAIASTNLSDSPDSPYRKVGDLIFLSGVPGGSTTTDDPQAEVKEVLDNLKQAAESAGGNINDIVKITVYMVDTDDDFPLLNNM